MSISLKIDKSKLDLDSNKKIAGLVITFILASILTIYGWTTSCFGMFIIGVMLYMIPHLLGVNNIKTLTAYGAIFLIAVLLIGAAFMAPAVVNNNSHPIANEDTFSEITCTYNDGSVTIETTYNGDTTGYDVVLRTYTVSGVGFTADQVYGSTANSLDYILTATYDPVSDKTTAIGTFDLGSSSLYIAQLGLVNDSDQFSEGTYSWFMVGLFSGSLTGIYFIGVFMSVVYVVIIFMMILFLSAFMRSRFEKTRSKMEEEGRLYPQGYGRCKKCNAVVLPGEVNCRKCGEYIDRPDELKPKKVDFFTCSECGAEVPSDATTCPKCGEKFDEETETEVIHSDGKVDVTTKNINCPDCGAEVPSTASFCPKCGKKF